jgi:uncharacterized protein
MDKGLAVVTGASAGIGWEMGLQLAARGYDLLLVARREERIGELARKIESEYRVKAEFLKLDLTSLEERRALITAIATEKERLRLMVNNAGFGALAPAVEISVARTLEMIELNVSALTELSLEAAKLMIPKRTGGIINVASTAAFQAVPYMSVYSATKAYVLSFTEGLAEELRESGVRVMALCPGYTRTEFQQVAGESTESSSRRRMMSPADCVRIGLREFEAGKRISITGIGNKLQTFASWISPRSVVVPAAGKLVRGRIGRRSATHHS